MRARISAPTGRLTGSPGDEARLQVCERMKGAALQPITAAPTIPSMRRLLYVNSALVLVIGIPLYLLSDQTDAWFAWTIHPPLTAAVLGAGYWASFILELLSARERLWARSRVAVPAVLLFSTLTLAITLLHADRFHFHSPQLITRAGTWGWLLVYVSVPLAMSWLLVAQLRQARPDPARVAPLAAWVRIVLTLQAAVMLTAGLLMLLTPTVMLGAWPWGLTPLTCRAIGAWAVGIGTIAAHSAWENDWWRLRPMMLSYTGLGVLQFTAVLRYRTDLDWSGAAAVVYVCFLSTILLLGGYGCWKIRRAHQAQQLTA
jgi:hypothetical protein